MDATRRIDLIRVGQSERGTFGVLRVGQVPFALTLEEPWRENQRRVSCIPAGTYRCARVQSLKFGETFQVLDVPGRSGILFHKGNTLQDTEGCILVGEQFALAEGFMPYIADSRAGYEEFMRLLQGVNECELVITEAP